MAALIAIETVVLAMLTLLVAGLLRSHATILRRLHELGAGLDPDGAAPATAPVHLTTPPADFAAAADIVGVGLVDDLVAVRVGAVAHRTLLAFLSSGCSTCHAFWDAFAAPAQLGLPADVRVVVVAKGTEAESGSALSAVVPDGVTVVQSSDAWHDYNVPGSPYFVLVDGRSARVIGEGTGVSWPQVLGLLLQAARDTEPRDATNETRIDHELLAAGIGPGDRSLYPAAGTRTGETR
jgi:hypothetical protein